MTGCIGGVGGSFHELNKHADCTVNVMSPSGFEAWLLILVYCLQQPVNPNLVREFGATLDQQPPAVKAVHDRSLSISQTYPLMLSPYDQLCSPQGIGCKAQHEGKEQESAGNCEINKTNPAKILSVLHQFKTKEGTGMI